MGEGTSAPKVPTAPVDTPHPSTTSELPTQLSLQAVPEHVVPPFVPKLAATKSDLPLRRVNSLPPYGPGPTQMYSLPKDVKPARSTSIRKSPSLIRKRWRPSPGTVRKTIVVRVKKLQDFTDASFRPPPLGSNPRLSRTFGSVKRVAFEPFGRNKSVTGAEQPTMVETTVLNQVEAKPPVRYITFLKRAKPEPTAAKRKTPETSTPIDDQSQPSKQRVPKEPFKAGKWLDDHFDLIRRPTQQRSKTFPVSFARSKQHPRWRRFTPARRTPTMETEDWVVIPRPPNKTIRIIKRQGRSMGDAVVKGWGRFIVVGSSMGQAVVSKMPRRKIVVVDKVAVRPEVEDTVRQVMGESASLEPEERRSVDESVSEQFHTDDDIVEAEPVPPEEETMQGRH